MAATIGLDNKPDYPLFFPAEHMASIDFPHQPGTDGLPMEDAAIIIPSGRHVSYLWNGAALAKAVGLPAVALCSHDSSAEDAAGLFDELSVPEWYAVDVPDGYTHPLFSYKAQDFIPDDLKHPGNIALKRNIGKALAALALFMDDDMLIMPRDATQAFRLLQQKDVGLLGLTQRGFPDKSRLYHCLDYQLLFRPDYAENAVASYLSGNSEAINTNRVSVHSPEGIYNEDWLEAAYVPRRKIRIVELPSYQHHIDLVGRLRNSRNTQEFGEIIGEAMIGARQQKLGREVLRQVGYWQEVVRRRLTIADWIHANLQANTAEINIGAMAAYPSEHMTDHEYRTLIADVVADIHAIDSSVAPQACINYINALDRDHRTHQQRFGAFRQERVGTTIMQRIKYLDLGDYTLSTQ